jgi:hypothetical protein
MKICVVHVLQAQVPICNKCAIFENDEEKPGWVAGKSAAYCEGCDKDKVNEKRVNTTKHDGHALTFFSKERKARKAAKMPSKMQGKQPY